MNYIGIIPFLKDFTMPVETWLWIILVIVIWRLPQIIQAIAKFFEK